VENYPLNLVPVPRPAFSGSTSSRYLVPSSSRFVRPCPARVFRIQDPGSSHAPSLKGMGGTRVASDLVSHWRTGPTDGVSSCARVGDNDATSGRSVQATRRQHDSSGPLCGNAIGATYELRVRRGVA